MRPIAFVLTTLAVAALGACSSAPITTPEVESLAGTSWELVRVQSMDDAKGATVVADPSLYTIAFGADGRAVMRLNCNRAQGPWQAVPAADRQSGSPSCGVLAGTRALSS